jgi:anti-sigma-K factor RskA
MSDQGMTHDEVAELLGAYALDAVDADERAAIEAHLSTCARCRAEVAEHREVAALLAHEGGDAPDGLWSRIAGSLDAPPPELRLRPVPPSAAAEQAERAVRAREAARPSRRTVPRWATAVLAAAAAVLVVLGVTVVRQGDRIDQLEATATTDPLEVAFQAALDDPTTTLVELASPDGSVQLRGAVTDDGRGFLRASSLPALDDDRTYQLWGAAPSGDLVSLGVLGADPGVVAFDASGFELLAVSEEDLPGVVAPTADPVVAGPLA